MGKRGGDTKVEVYQFSSKSLPRWGMEQTELCSSGLFKQQPATKLRQFASIALEGDMQMSLMNPYNSSPSSRSLSPFLNS